MVFFLKIRAQDGEQYSDPTRGLLLCSSRRIKALIKQWIEQMQDVRIFIRDILFVRDRLIRTSDAPMANARVEDGGDHNTSATTVLQLLYSITRSRAAHTCLYVFNDLYLRVPWARYMWSAVPQIFKN